MTEQYKRLTLASAGIIAWALIAFAYFYLEHTLYLNPCPLCMVQRLAFALVGTAFLIDAAWWSDKKINRLLMKLFKYGSIFYGVGLAARHLYIQSLPADEAPACGLDFYGLLEQNSWLSAIWQSMQGTGDCAVKDTWLGLTIPTWAMAGFVAMLVVAIVSEPSMQQNYTKRQK